MKIGIYSPYFHILGGGEKYILDIASILGKKNQVDLFADKKLVFEIFERFGIRLDGINFLGDVFRDKDGRKKLSSLGILKLTRNYDAFFFVTDGSLFLSMARKNFLIVQVPQKSMYSLSAEIRFKLHFWHRAIVYSRYVKDLVQNWWPVHAAVIPPFVEFPGIIETKKEPIILSVGRFFPLPHSKKQDFLIEAFKTIYQKNGRLRLILAGGVDKSGFSYFEKVKKAAEGMPVEFYPNISREKLCTLYRRSSFYWHAAGFGEDLEKYPERAEHFGITTLEAMSYGLVPFVFPAGGQKEIIEDKISGFFYQTKNELVEKTIILYKDQELFKKMQWSVQNRVLVFNRGVFTKHINNLLK